MRWYVILGYGFLATLKIIIMVLLNSRLSINSYFSITLQFFKIDVYNLFRCHFGLDSALNFFALNLAKFSGQCFKKPATHRLSLPRFPMTIA